MKFLIFLIITVLIICADAKWGRGGGGKSSGGSRSGGGSPSAPSYNGGHVNSGNHQNTGGHSNTGNNYNSGHSNNNNYHGSSHGSPGSPNSNNDNNNKKKSSSSKTALAGGLLAGGMLGYAAGSHHGSHHSKNNSTKCNTRKLPRTVNETSCCPSIPPSIKVDYSCRCDQNDSSTYFSCVVECTLENEGWLNDNSTIDKEAVVSSILNKTEHVWAPIIPPIVEKCIESETKDLKESANETEIAYANVEIVKCIRVGYVHHCPKEIMVESKLCKKFFKFVASCAEYPFL